MRLGAILLLLVFSLPVVLADSTALVNWTISSNPHTVTWTNPQLGRNSDDQRTTGAAAAQLNVSGFGHSLPTESIIDGIVLKLEVSASSATSTNQLFFRLGNSTTWTSQNTTGDRGTADANLTYGSSVDKWGITWDTNAITNLQVNLTSGATSTRTMRIDDLRTQIHYTPPVLNFTTVTINDSTPYVNDSINISTTTLYTGSASLSTIKFMWNATGATCNGGFQNVTNWTITGTSFFANATWKVPEACADKVIGYAFFSNTPALNNQTIMQTFTPTLAPSNSCTYDGSGNWAITCSDNCNLVTNTDLLGNNITFSGEGLVRIRANFTNLAKARIQSGCTVRCETGGCQGLI